MGFSSIDSLVYTGSLIGALGGILGVVNGVRYSQMKQIAVFGVMTVACGFGLGLFMRLFAGSEIFWIQI